jgi:hypothetical protein
MIPLKFSPEAHVLPLTGFKKNTVYTDKKENNIFLIYKNSEEIGCELPSNMTNGLLIYGEIFAHFLIY